MFPIIHSQHYFCVFLTNPILSQLELPEPKEVERSKHTKYLSPSQLRQNLQMYPTYKTPKRRGGGYSTYKMPKRVAYMLWKLKASSFWEQFFIIVYCFLSHVMIYACRGHVLVYCVCIFTLILQSTILLLNRR
jgi:hypothetical protein